MEPVFVFFLANKNKLRQRDLDANDKPALPIRNNRQGPASPPYRHHTHHLERKTHAQRTPGRRCSGEVARFVGRQGAGRIARLALISAVPPLMVQRPDNPGGVPREVFDGLRASQRENRAQFYLDIPSGPFYGFNRPGATPSPALSNPGSCKAC